MHDYIRITGTSTIALRIYDSLFGRTERLRTTFRCLQIFIDRVQVLPYCRATLPPLKKCDIHMLLNALRIRYRMLEALATPKKE